MDRPEFTRTYALYCQRVAGHFGIPADLVSSRKRSVDVVQAKRVVWLALQADGATPAIIARCAGLHHSTVAHGLRTACKHELLQRLAARIRVLSVPDRFNPHLLGVTYAQAAALRDYCRWLVGHGHFAAPALVGIQLLAARPHLRAQLAEACSGYQVAAHLFRVRIHAAQINCVWVDAHAVQASNVISTRLWDSPIM